MITILDYEDRQMHLPSHPVAEGRSRWASLRLSSRHVAAGAGTAGIFLLSVNVVGLFMPLRGPSLHEDFTNLALPGSFPRSAPTLLSYKETESRLAALDIGRRGEFVMAANRIFSEGMAHFDYLQWRPGDPHLDEYRLSIPIWENYSLWALRYIKPDTYAAYELTDYQRALKRGVGLCGQKATALIGYLSERGFRTAYVYVPGHVLVTVEVEHGDWYLLDPAFDVSIPRPPWGIDEEIASSYYKKHSDSESIKALAKGDIQVLPGGPEARFPRASRIEAVAYGIKWPLPLLLLLPAILRFRFDRKKRKDESVGSGARAAVAIQA
jgi:hypothetical protein